MPRAERFSSVISIKISPSTSFSITICLLNTCPFHVSFAIEQIRKQSPVTVYFATKFTAASLQKIQNILDRPIRLHHIISMGAISNLKKINCNSPTSELAGDIVGEL
jgi:hypothetical protein